jgi:hypothetical protein
MVLMDIDGLYPRFDTDHLPAPNLVGGSSLNTSLPSTRPSASRHALGPSNDDTLGADLT